MIWPSLDTSDQRTAIVVPGSAGLIRRLTSQYCMVCAGLRRRLLADRLWNVTSHTTRERFAALLVVVELIPARAAGAEK